MGMEQEPGARSVHFAVPAVVADTVDYAGLYSPKGDRDRTPSAETLILRDGDGVTQPVARIGRLGRSRNGSWLSLRSSGSSMRFRLALGVLRPTRVDPNGVRSMAVATYSCAVYHIQV